MIELDEKFEKFLGLLPNPVTCHPSENVLSAIEKIKNNEIGSIVIVENNLPIGIFTERDALNKVAGLSNTNLEETTISQFMTEEPKTVSIDTSLRDGLKVMRMGNFRHLVIVDNNGALVKVFSVRDFLNVLIDLLL